MRDYDYGQTLLGKRFYLVTGLASREVRTHAIFVGADTLWSCSFKCDLIPGAEVGWAAVFFNIRWSANTKIIINFCIRSAYALGKVPVLVCSYLKKIKK